MRNSEIREFREVFFPKFLNLTNLTNLTNGDDNALSCAIKRRAEALDKCR